jgi:hypothetical protein
MVFLLKYMFLLLFQKNCWRKFRAPKGVGTPKGRRSHTATVFQVKKNHFFCQKQ